MSDAPLRVYLTGTLRVESGLRMLDETRLPGRQGRVAFALLAAEHGRAVSTGELAEQVWGGEPPGAWEVALRAIVSKLRAALGEVGPDGHHWIGHAFGCYQMTLPAGAWIDLDAAADAVHRAETALRDGDANDAMGWSLAANAIARRRFLPGEDGPWVEARRAELRTIRVRALEVRAQVNLERGDHEASARDAELVLALEPFRETALRLLMRALAAAGNRAEALRVYERSRRSIAAELGVDPSSETERVYLEILRSP